MNVKIIPEKYNKQSIFIYVPDFLNKDEIQYLYDYLQNLNNFKNNYNYNNKKVIRLQKWYQINNKYFCLDWKKKYERWKSHDYDNNIIEIQNKIQKYIDNHLPKYNIKIPKLNSCLINKYRNNKDRIRPHKDTHKSFGLEPTIIGLSIGASRYIKFNRIISDEINLHNYKPDKTKSHLNFFQLLTNGSLFIMAGDSQKYWTHEIPEWIESENNKLDNIKYKIHKSPKSIEYKSNKLNNIRYSLTFREYLI